MKKSRNFREYTVWQDAVEYATYIYEVTNNMPRLERKGLCDQLQRAAVSIASNIAEGSARPTDSDFAHFLDIALGSAFEVETQLMIAKKIEYINENQYQNLITKLSSIERQITAFINSIRIS